jgi:hypothetical protein
MKMEKTKQLIYVTMISAVVVFIIISVFALMVATIKNPKIWNALS